MRLFTSSRNKDQSKESHNFRLMFEPAELKTPPTRAYLTNQSTARCPRGASIRLSEKSDKKSLTLKGRSQLFLTAQDRSAASHQEELTRSKICPKFYWQIFFGKVGNSQKITHAIRRRHRVDVQRQRSRARRTLFSN